MDRARNAVLLGHSAYWQYRAARPQKDVQFCSEMTGQPLYKATAAEPDLCFFHEIDTIEGVLPGYFSSYAVAYPSGWPRPGKGGLHGRGKEHFV